MASFPKIDSPCPIRWNAMPTADRNFCTQCERKVHNLDALNDAQRREFLAGCNGSVCVAYTLRPQRAVLSARVGLGLAAALALSPGIVGAQDTPLQSPVQATSLTPKADYIDCDRDKTDEEKSTGPMEQIFVGGVSNPHEAEWQNDSSALPVLPQVASDAFLDTQAPAEFVAAPVTSAK